MNGNLGRLLAIISIFFLPPQLGYTNTIINCDKSIVSFDKKDGTILGRFTPDSLEETAKLSTMPDINALSAQYSVCIDTAGQPVKRWDVTLPRAQFASTSVVLQVPSLKLVSPGEKYQLPIRELQPLSAGKTAIEIGNCRIEMLPDERKSLKCKRSKDKKVEQYQRGIPGYFRIPWPGDENGIYVSQEFIFVRQGRWLHFYERRLGKLVTELEVAGTLSIMAGFDWRTRLIEALDALLRGGMIQYSKPLTGNT